jgi:hypothetical protein
MKLTTPSDIRIPEEKTDELLKKIEAQLVKEKEYVPDVHNPNLIKITVKIAGHYTPLEMEKAKANYINSGWNSVEFRKVYPTKETSGNGYNTYVTLTAPIPAK